MAGPIPWNTCGFAGKNIYDGALAEIFSLEGRATCGGGVLRRSGKDCAQAKAQSPPMVLGDTYEMKSLDKSRRAASDS
jgi:hypothetical protein